MRKITLSLAVLAALAFALAGSANATIVFTDENLFKAALQPGYYLEDFPGDGWYPMGYTADFVDPVNGWSYRASESRGVLWHVPAGGGALSTQNSADCLTITFPETGKPVTAVGGQFFGTDYDGNRVPAEITILLSDGTTEMFNSSTGYDFRGFTYTTVQSLSVRIPASAGNPLNSANDPGPYTTLDHFYVGELAGAEAPIIPEPLTMLGMVFGLGGVGAYIRRRRTA